MIGLHEDVCDMFARYAAVHDVRDMLDGYGPIGYRDMEASKGAAWLRANGHEDVGHDHGDRLVRASAEYVAQEADRMRRYWKTPAGVANRARYNAKRNIARAAARARVQEAA